eukprot:1190776-Prymnesium_polylepis.1
MLPVLPRTSNIQSDVPRNLPRNMPMNAQGMFPGTCQSHGQVDGEALGALEHVPLQLAERACDRGAGRYSRNRRGAAWDNSKWFQHFPIQRSGKQWWTLERLQAQSLVCGGRVRRGKRGEQFRHFVSPETRLQRAG